MGVPVAVTVGLGVFRSVSGGEGCWENSKWRGLGICPVVVVVIEQFVRGFEFT